MTDIASITRQAVAQAHVPASIPSVQPAPAQDPVAESTSVAVAATASVTYTPLAKASTSTIRGVGVSEVA